MEVGSKVWVKVPPPALWEKGTVTKKAMDGGGFLLTVQLESGSTKDFKTTGKDSDEIEDLKVRNVAGQATVVEGPDVRDLTRLTHLHEPAILSSLSARYAADHIYTYTGPILLAVNPFKSLPLYSDTELAKYKADGESRAFDPNYNVVLAPHVYALADKSYRNMIMPASEYLPRSQSILVSGESGAGKTETCKIIMKYLAVLGSNTGGGDALGDIEKAVLQTNPILEAFGNARTVRNDNSSRFGKYIQMLFTEDRGRLTGASIRTFLLEKVRVVRQSAQERNYHVFYALASAPAEARARWNLASPRDYHYTNQSGCYERRDGVSDEFVFRELMEAFNFLGVAEAQYGGCLDVVATVLALGNINFEAIAGAADDAPKAAATAASAKFLETAAELLGSDPELIASALTSRQVMAGMSHQVTIYLTAEQATAARDALAKALYAAMFQWIVTRVNAAMDRSGEEAAGAAAAAAGGGTDFETDKPFVGLLDIFGFEIFEQNYFEQFLINYANEMLQQQFNDFIFRQEQEEYEVEQIEWTFISFPDNKDCLALIENKPNGIIPTLDEQCLVGQPTDERFANQLYRKCEGNPRFAVASKMRVDHQFQVHHYAGKVTYSTTGIIDKNRDTLSQEGVDLLRSSCNPFVVLMGDIEAAVASTSKGGSKGGGGGGAPGNRNSMNLKRAPSLRRMGSQRGVMRASGGGGARRSTIGAKSLGTQFKDSLVALTKAIGATLPHYVRCVKPNDKLVPGEFNAARIADQLRNAGVLEVVRVARSGFPVRLGISEFVARYAVLAPLTVEEAYKRSNTQGELEQERFVCRELLLAVLALAAPGEVPPKDFAAACRDNGLQMGLTKVFFQQHAYNKIEKLRTAALAKAAVLVQKHWRGHRARQQVLIMRGKIAPPPVEDLAKKRRAEAAVKAIGDWWMTQRLSKEREAAFAAELSRQKEAFEAQIAALKQELAAARAEVDVLKSKPATFVVVAAPLAAGGNPAEVAAAAAKALAAAGVDGAKTLTFE